MSENENPEIFNRDMVAWEGDIKSTENLSNRSSNPLQQPFVEFSFLEISIISASLSSKITRSEEIFCTITCETTSHQVKSCISSNEGKYFFPKDCLKYILTQTSKSQEMTFTFFNFKETFGVSCFQFDAQSMTSKRHTLPIKLNDLTIGEITFLPQLQEEGYFDDSESDCTSSIASRTPPSSYLRRIPLQATFTGQQSPIPHRSRNEHLTWSTTSQLSPSLMTHLERSPAPPASESEPDSLSPNLSLLSHFNLEEESNDVLPAPDASLLESLPPISPPSSPPPEVAEEGLESEGSKVEALREPSIYHETLESCPQPLGNSLKIKNPKEFQSGGKKFSSWLTPTNVMIGFLAIFLILKSSSRSSRSGE